MSSPTKRCKLCHQELPPLPQLPTEVWDKILSYVPFEVHLAVAGASPAVRRRALRRPERLARYAEHDPIADDAFAAHWSIGVDDPARLYVGALCRATSAKNAQRFFNKCVPRSVAVRMLNEPSAASNLVLSRRWPWWRLARALVTHEAKCGRDRRPTNVRVIADKYDDDNLWMDSNVSLISDASAFKFDSTPDSIATVELDGENIQVYVCKGQVYRVTI
ncbi:LEF-7 [Dione juno nucleopolyhedrovirus]|uniref:LEF-7 n=1 Tax=Dione juno nucleopolyhedrovirus TaxID=2594175 RepID=A0AAE6H2X9_9ABAC|nr:LEF-7 [Dione juno nucleopolyhedrovirus]QDL56948.1 LEF-7 [Dione juno nucleopolyhedrovirus]